MNALMLDNYGVVEMEAGVMQETDGGSFWGTVAKICTRSVPVVGTIVLVLDALGYAADIAEGIHEGATTPCHK